MHQLNLGRSCQHFWLYDCTLYGLFISFPLLSFSSKLSILQAKQKYSRTRCPTLRITQLLQHTLYFPEVSYTTHSNYLQCFLSSFAIDSIPFVFCLFSESKARLCSSLLLQMALGLVWFITIIFDWNFLLLISCKAKSKHKIICR